MLQLNQKGNSYPFIILTLVILIIAGGIFYLNRQKPKDQQVSVADSKNAVVFNVTAKNFEFSTKEIHVKLGDTVKIVLTNDEGFHDWVIDEFNARTGRLSQGQSAVVEFKADKKGTFEYYCSVGTHRQMGMRGNLIVE